jgi:hypothetical protein
MKLSSLLGFAFSAICIAPSLRAAPQDTARRIIQRSVQANAEDWKAAPQYDYFERDHEQNGETQTYEEIMILGSPYRRLVEVDGKPISEQQQVQQRQKMDAAVRERRNESPQERAKRTENYEQERQRDELLLDQMAKAFDFKVTGNQNLGSFEVYVLTAKPRPGYEPPNIRAKVLTGMEGKLWIDKKTFQWVKVEAKVIHPVSIEGFLARVEPGTQFELEKMPVTNGIWLPKHFAMKSKAKILFFFTRRKTEEEDYFGYHLAKPVEAAGDGK